MSSSQIWVPGAPGPSLDDFVARVHKGIEEFAQRRGLGAPAVEVELVDGSIYSLHKIRPEPGYGFVTLCPHPEGENAQWDGECTPEEIIVPVGSIRRLTLSDVEEARARFGFSLPEAG